MAERNSYHDGSLIRGYSIHVQRYEFAARFCGGCKVLDAGCGIGYGSAYLACHGAASVTGVDLSSSALEEGRALYPLSNLRFLQGDVQRLSEVEGLSGPFDCVVNLENIEHLPEPERFLDEAVKQLDSGGVLVCSTPNGKLTKRDATGRIANPYHIREYTESEFRELLGSRFPEVLIVGQWQTPAGKSRIEYARRVFDQLCEAYYNPLSRAGRVLKRVLGRPVCGPPQFTAEGESFPTDYEILELDASLYPWDPEYLLAVCRKAKTA